MNIKKFLLKKWQKIKYLATLEIKLHISAKVDLCTDLERYTKVYRDVSILSTKVGEGSYIGWNSILNNTQIGRYCSIAPYTEVIYGQHPTQMVSSHPSFYSVAKQSGFTYVDNDYFSDFKYACVKDKSSVVIGNDVWIGYGVKILEGVTIGDGAIIGANSLVTKDIEPYSICVGVPAKKIRSRFDKDTITFLLELQWWNKDRDWLKENAKYFLSPEQLIQALKND